MSSQQVTFTALGSQIRLTIISPRDVSELLASLQRRVLQFELHYSRFLPHSDLTRLNERAGQRVAISPEFHDILARAAAMSRATDGLFNPFVLPALQQAGYTKSFVPGYEHDDAPDYSLRTIPTADDLQLGDDWVQLPHWSALDLGGCGKGYIGDQLAGSIDAESDITGYWLSIGGDVVVCGTHDDGRPLAVSLPPRDHESMPGQVRVRPGERLGVATSTTLKRRGTKNGRDWHHIIDPRTHQPAETDIVTVTVVAARLLDADIHASNCIILGSQSMAAYLDRHDVIAARAELTDHSFIYDDPLERISRRQQRDLGVG